METTNKRTKEQSLKLLRKYVKASVVPCHEWGDSWEHWAMMRKAVSECGEVFRKARVFVYDKEKYGTYNCSVLGMYDGTLRWLLGAYSVRFETNWYDYVDRFFAKILRIIGFVKIVNRLQVKLVNRGLQKIYLKYPEIVNELVCDVECYDWIKGEVDGEFIHKKYWIER